MLSSTSYYISDVMCRSLYDYNAYDLIFSQIKKTNKETKKKQKSIYIDLNLVLCVNRKDFHSDFPSRMSPQFIRVSYPRKFLYRCVGYICSPVISVILHKPHQKDMNPNGIFPSHQTNQILLATLGQVLKGWQPITLQLSKIGYYTHGQFCKHMFSCIRIGKFFCLSKI